MKTTPATYKPIIILLYMLIFILSVGFIGIPVALSHGGKVHAEDEFTAYSALQKASKLYGQLLTRGKLSENWELDLANISISTRAGKNGKEFIVRFQLSSGEPNQVFIFFDSSGNYLGSNFSGK